MRLHLEVPAPAVSAVRSAGAPASAVRLALGPSMAAAAGRSVVNRGCDTDDECTGRYSEVGGMKFCCKAGCGSSCSVSVSSNNGDVVAVCSCSRAAVAVMVAEDWQQGGGFQQIGHAALMSPPQQLAADAEATPAHHGMPTSRLFIGQDGGASAMQ